MGRRQNLQTGSAGKAAAFCDRALAASAPRFFFFFEKKRRRAVPKGNISLLGLPAKVESCDVGHPHALFSVQFFLFLGPLCPRAPVFFSTFRVGAARKGPNRKGPQRDKPPF
nr:hypothetical protein [Pandoravirus massiliensis]